MVRRAEREESIEAGLCRTLSCKGRTWKSNPDRKPRRKCAPWGQRGQKEVVHQAPLETGSPWEGFR